MARRSILAAASFAALAAAGPQLSPPVIQDNAQLGELHLPITCDIYGGLPTTFEVTAYGEAPAYAAPGAEYYLSDVAGSIYVPPAVVKLANSAGASAANASITIYMNSTNASPAEVIAYQGYVHVDFPVNQSTTIKFPGEGGVISKVGPFTIDAAATGASLTQIGNTIVSLQLLDASGNPTGLTVPTSCGKQDVSFTLTSVTITDDVVPGTYDPAPANGYIQDFGVDVPVGYEYGFFKFPYNCEFQYLGQEIIDLTIGGLLPLFLEPGESFSLLHAESFLEVPASLVTLAKNGFPTVDTFLTTVSSFTLDFTNTSPASIDVASGGPITSVTSVRNVNASLPLTIPIPPYFPLTIGPIAAGSTVGNYVTMAAGNATAHTDLRNSTNSVLFGFDITCSPYFEGSLIAVTITDQVPANMTLGKNNTSS